LRTRWLTANTTCDLDPDLAVFQQLRGSGQIATNFLLAIGLTVVQNCSAAKAGAVIFARCLGLGRFILGRLILRLRWFGATRAAVIHRFADLWLAIRPHVTRKGADQNIRDQQKCDEYPNHCQTYLIRLFTAERASRTATVITRSTFASKQVMKF
jgi:hypothetical protein